MRRPAMMVFSSARFDGQGKRMRGRARSDGRPLDMVRQRVNLRHRHRERGSNTCAGASEGLRASGTVWGLHRTCGFPDELLDIRFVLVAGEETVVVFALVMLTA